MIAWIAWTIAVSTLVAVAAALLERVASYIGAPRRFVWIAAMIVAAGAPVLLPARVSSTLLRSSPAARFVSGGASIQRLPSSSSSAETHRRLPASWDAAILTAWALWSSVLLVSLMRGIVHLRRRASSWTATDTEVGRVFVSAEDGPAVVGWLKPRIVIPSWALAGDSATRSMVLRHEFEHLHAGDTRALLLAELVRCAFPWNAALFWVADRLRVAIEMDCDARVLRAVGSPHTYGVMLLEVSERLGRALPLAASSLARQGDLERRLAVLAMERRRRAWSACTPYALVALIVLTTAAWTPKPGFPLTVRRATGVRLSKSGVPAPAISDSLPTDSVVRQTANAAYENAEASQRGSGATIWILAEPTGKPIASVVEAPQSDRRSDVPGEPLVSVDEVARLFPQNPDVRWGFQFSLIRRNVVLHADTVTVVWAQLQEGSK